MPVCNPDVVLVIRYGVTDKITYQLRDASQNKY